MSGARPPARGIWSRLRTLPWLEVLMLGRFVLTGLAATALHIAVAFAAIGLLGWSVFPANLLAFLCGFALAFTGHYYFTFRSSARYHQALRRYFIISTTAFLVNNGLLLVLVKSGFLSDIASIVLAAAVIPLVSYTASRLWGFRA